MPIKEILPFLVVIGLLVYARIIGFALHLWQKRTSRIRPANFLADPDAWVRYWRPQLLIVEIFALVGIVGFCFLLATATPILRGPDARYVIEGWILALILSVLIFVGCDVLTVQSARRAAHRQRMARNAGEDAIHDHAHS